MGQGGMPSPGLYLHPEEEPAWSQTPRIRDGNKLGWVRARPAASLGYEKGVLGMSVDGEGEWRPGQEARSSVTPPPACL